MRTYHLRDFMPGPPHLALRQQLWNKNMQAIEHRHDCVEIVFILAGSGVNFIDQVTFPIIAGDLYVINRGAVHSFFSNNELRFYNLMFDFKFFSRAEQQLFRSEPGFSELFAPPPEQLPNKLPLTPDEAKEIRDLFDRLHREHRSGKPGGELNSRAYLTLLLNFLCRIAADRPPPRPALPDPRSDALARIIEFLNIHYLEPLDFDALARTAELSANYVGEFFCARTGIAPVRYMISLRIERARRLLLDAPELGITEVARRSGFHDSSYFTRMFRRHTGKSPRAYRRDAEKYQENR